MSEETSSTVGRSPWYYARKRFARNKPALFGLFWLVFMAALAIVAPLVGVDKTENANFIILELPKQPPGTRANLLLRPNHAAPPERGFLGAILHGQPDRYRPIPLKDGNSVELEGDSIHYTDLKGQEQYEDLVLFMLPVDPYHPKAELWLREEGRPYHRDGDLVKYLDPEGKEQEASLGELRQRFRQEHITERTFWFGTDSFGRDVFSRLVQGTRVSLSVGFMAVLVSLLLGIAFGAAAGFFRGKVDSLIMWFVSVVWSVPTLLLAISISFVLGKGFWQLFIAIGVSMWVEVARIVRGQIFALRELQYVEATRALGYKPGRAIIRHVLPNILSPIIIVSAANFASAILIEAGLSFLGVGVASPTPSWGAMIQEGYTQIFFDSGFYLAIFPGLAIILVVISLNLVGYGLRDALDPKYDQGA